MNSYYFDFDSISDEFDKEKKKYESDSGDTTRYLVSWEKENPNQPLTGAVAFGISSTLGVRHGDVLAIAKELDVSPSPSYDKEYEEAFKKHRGVSRVGAEQKFKGGLGGHSDEEVKLHTATHLLNAALKKVLGEHVKQKGSNITAERLRFDFSHSAKMTDEEKAVVERFVNDAIAADIPVTRTDMPKEEAEKLGAEMEFGAKYPDMVSVYTIGDENDPISREFCGGPHVAHTGELGTFTIIKEEASSAGVRRIKATLS
jgi:alanyl-tRNA synthetase